MKKLVLVLMMAVMISGITYAQDANTKGTGENANTKETVSNSPHMEFDKVVHDYGTIVENSDGRCVFKITNTGREPLILTDIRSTCGCTVPRWERTPILPGQSSEIEVKYSTKRIGKIHKSVTVISNADNSPVSLKLKGEILKKGDKRLLENNVDQNSTPKANIK